MKKRSGRPRAPAASRQSGRTQAAGGEEEKRPGNRGRPRKAAAPAASDGFDHAAEDETADGGVAAGGAQKHPESKSRASGRLSTAVCRLCHGKFSPRSLRHAFDQRPRDESDAAAAESPLFHADFQRLVGVQLDRDPRLSEFICKKCHSKFYKCHGVLRRFLQRVNLPPVGKENLESWKECPEAPGPHAATGRSQRSQTSRTLTAPPAPRPFTSDPEVLGGLVSWAHRHGEACRSCPALREVLEERRWGSVKAVWGCVDGHRYVMDANPGYGVDFYGGALGSGNGDGAMSGEEEGQPRGNGRMSAPPALPVHSSADWSAHTEDFTGHQGAAVQLEDRAADSDLSDRFISEDDLEGVRRGLSDDEMFEPYSDKRARSRASVPGKRRRSPKALVEPKVKKKPGPKPGWKNKLKPKGEELPNIYKCPYQGCTAVYRAPDGLKKHIKEHHEEVKERPCPHPGCNKVFMIDRYLQRHVKLIHTEERNYICDQCGQTFKQRKHLSVHQMRHSGAKPLQCEVCGFQCRQRASLKYHMTKHKAEAELEFACPMCGKRFEKAHNLNVHMSMVHPLIQATVQRGGAPPPPPPYSDPHAIAPTGGEVVQQDQDR
ncbi:LOW QUALITY PROTEIN: zinc finger protein 276 [Pseudoliparis swirei]|uniref:LOW QUALITY PROTEIN: zinc finger protein 276 n=1 Tax=Pseudoliparis swirei TaxID=2059687 RepID=UPI0024BDFFF1|nr:LOW QUALITY PROTEIN: zinc finger protein 276 [Pseudoliparis swirei]